MTSPSHHHNRDLTTHIVARVQNTVARYQLITPGEHIVIGVSGGPDSTCLAVVLHEFTKKWDLTLHLAHLNYGTRGDESESDEHFVRALAQQLRLSVSIKRVTSDDLACGDRESFQARARGVRYRFLHCVAQQNGAHKIATGHTADDQAETVLMWTLRGAGLTGIRGIPVHHHKIVRPLITLTRTDVLAYLNATHSAFRTDSTNKDPVFFRNRIRHELIPLLETYNPQIRRSLSHLADIANEEETVLRRMTEQAFQDILVRQPNSNGRDSSCYISRSRFLGLARGLQRRCIRQAVVRIKGHTRRLTFLHIETIIAFITEPQKPGVTCELCGIRATHEQHDAIHLTATNISIPITSCEVRQLTIPGEIQLPTIGCRMRAWREPPIAADDSATNGVSTIHDPLVARFDEDTFRLPLTIRPWQAGDVFFPSGMGGKRKKLHDYFIDEKVPKPVRSQIPLLVAMEGILWIAGYRQDDRFRRRSTTQRMCSVQLIRCPK